MPGPQHLQYGAEQEGETRHSLDVFFKPRSIAVVGASERPGSVGRKVFWNILNSPFGGAVYPVNQSRRQVLGVHAHARLSDIKYPLDLAVIVTPADTVPGVLDDCAAAGVGGAIIISAGFTERGEPGRALEAQIRERARRGGIRVIGPNSLGIMNPMRGLNAAYSANIALKGSVGFISQSGALCASVLDWSFRAKTGFSKFVSFGAMVDVQWSDLIYYLGDDPKTKSIVIYMESIGDARSFLSAAREVALTKPIIVLKAGQTESGARAARHSAYTSTDTGDDAVLAAALMRCGVLRVDDVETLFAMADTLGKQPRPRGPRLAIVSNAAGPGILATDALVRAGGELAPISPATMDELNTVLPSYWNRNNPVDVVADADPDRYSAALAAVAKDPANDGMLVILTPQATTDPTATAEAVGRMDRGHGKPVIASWMGGEAVAQGARILTEHLVPCFAYPDAAARVYAAMWRYSYALRGLYETAQPLSGEGGEAREEARRIVEGARALGRVSLTEEESKAVLSAYGLPVAPSLVARSADEAAAHAEALGWPVSMKLNGSPVTCDLQIPIRQLSQINADEARRAFDRLMENAGEARADGVSIRPAVRTAGYQIVLAAFVDPQFGPCIEFGAGGPLAGVLRDRAIALPPVNTTLARRTMERTRISRALRGARGSIAVDMERLEQILVSFGDLVVDLPRIREIEINPLFATAERIEALDARIVLHDADVADDILPKPAIRPYPARYTREAVLKDGTRLTMRPIRPEDEGMLVAFHKTLSSETVYFRYLRLLSFDQRIRHERLSQMCFIDYARQIGLVAEARDPDTGGHRILAISRIVRIHGTNDADFALVVSDAVQGQGLGEAMLRHLLDVARDEKISRVIGVIHPENTPMHRLCRKVGFTLCKPVGDEVQAVFVKE